MGTAKALSRSAPPGSSVEPSERAEMVSRLVAGTAHDLNDLLAVIQTNAELLAAILVHPDFVAGNTPTRWLEATLPDLLPPPTES